MSSNVGYKSFKSRGKQFYYWSFHDALAYQEFVDWQMQHLDSHHTSVYENMVSNAKERILDGAEELWYGWPHPQSVAELEQHNKFLGMHLLRAEQDNMRPFLKPYMEALGEELMPQPYLEFNSHGEGNFSFDAFAFGMYPGYFLEGNGPLDLAEAQLRLELGRPSWRSHNSKVYVNYKHKLAEYPALRLFVHAGANANINGEQLLYIGIACHEVVKFLEARGVPVEVNVLNASYWNERVVCSVIPIKKFSQRLSTNDLMLYSSDPRFFRFTMFRGLIAMANAIGKDLPHSLGRDTGTLGQEFVAGFDTRGLVFEGAYSQEACQQEIKRVIETYLEFLNLWKSL